MEQDPTQAKRAPDQKAIAPLIELCKAGRLFDVQAWIAAGKPVNPPPFPGKGHRPRTPLEIAIERGFHSLVQVLLEAGAVQEPTGYNSPMSRVLQARRFDMVQLLVEHGFDPKAVGTNEVFSTWDPAIIRFFIDRGCELKRGRPFAYALCDKIRTVLSFYKEAVQRDPEFQEQGNIALRYHCKEGNLKWVSLLLWAGADPLQPGPDDPSAGEEPEEWGTSALGFAALYEHYEIFDLKPVRAKLAAPEIAKTLPYLTHGKGVDVLKRVLEKGLNPNDVDGSSCSAFGSALDRMGWSGHYPGHSLSLGYGTYKGDTSQARDALKAVHLLAKHGGKWAPADKYAKTSARKALVGLIPDYTLEFVWIMGKYHACTLECIKELLSTPAMKAHTARHVSRLAELLHMWDPPAPPQ